ncbi:MoaD/ThiS family protein [Arthrobacter cryoconiti]|uniref:MoaD/ThiS family protein n=1 Tax=Arthrobacter cryoconiti TaxID=748907 RepID=A0ABV8R0N2_9MICC|nr:MoaD/ThiS family protein [Arthrobacter cryoconiti]MCC9069278.1 MoaD/ThiS family protein [Arthrobacter cryoconiti]
MLIGYFASARTASGVDEERLDLEPLTLGDLRGILASQHPKFAWASAPSRATLLSRCIFLSNKVALPNMAAVLEATAVVAVLPTFAGE